MCNFTLISSHSAFKVTLHQKSIGYFSNRDHFSWWRKKQIVPRKLSNNLSNCSQIHFSTARLGALYLIWYYLTGEIGWDFNSNTAVTVALRRKIIGTEKLAICKAQAQLKNNYSEQFKIRRERRFQVALLKYMFIFSMEIDGGQLRI